jgi:hypothetical protein
VGLSICSDSEGAPCLRLVSSFPSSRWEDWRSVHLCCFGGGVTSLLERPRVRSDLSGALSGFPDRVLHLEVLVVSFLTRSFEAEKDAASWAGKHRFATTYARGNNMGKMRVAISAIALGLVIGSTGVASAAPRARR